MITTLHGDCRDTLKTIPDGSVHCCVSSPPYWGLRSYLPKDHPDKHREIGQEKTPEAFVQTMVEVFREVRRCLHDSGTLWLNLGDSYAYEMRGGSLSQYKEVQSGRYSPQGGKTDDTMKSQHFEPRKASLAGLKPKDLCLIPWRVVMALQADGWWVRSVIVWHKKSCMPESVTDRPTNSWEPIFLLAKSARYFYDAEAVKEPSDYPELAGKPQKVDYRASDALPNGVQSDSVVIRSSTRNQRNVWSLGPEPFSEAHFATFPTEIPRRAILAGTSARGCCPKCLTPWERQVETKSINRTELPKDHPEYRPSRYVGKYDGSQTVAIAGERRGQYSESRTVGWQPGCKCEGDWSGSSMWRHQKPLDPIPCTVLDPFGGSGTTGAVALELGRNAILCELNDDYLPLINQRTNVTKGLALA